MYLGLCTVDSPRFLKCIAVSQSLESSLTVRCPADSPASPARTRPRLWQWTASEAPHRLQETPAKTPPTCTHRHTQWITDLKIYYTKIKIYQARYFSPLINFCEQQFTDNKICKYKFPLTKCLKKITKFCFFHQSMQSGKMVLHNQKHCSKWAWCNKYLFSVHYHAWPSSIL